jgi:hypothetical protein
MYDLAKELQFQMYLDAKAHNDRYLLPRRPYRRLYGPPSGLDRKWEAADALVAGGYARWLPSWALSHPGLLLTGKPLADPRLTDRRSPRQLNQENDNANDH